MTQLVAGKIEQLTDDKPCMATPRGTLLEQVMNPNVPKNEREWAAAEELSRLRQIEKRYEYVRELQPDQFEKIFDDSFPMRPDGSRRNITASVEKFNAAFDSLIDKAIQLKGE